MTRTPGNRLIRYHLSKYGYGVSIDSIGSLNSGEFLLKFSTSDRFYIGFHEIQQQISNYKNVGNFVTIYEVINTIVSFLVFGLGFSLC